ncbi:hypothetical protein E2C01_062044 [Portunus trituberculatus]|uniref:Uncharacterized protein n=1 Tax=Portunus trituberculatus TaxID=210409 RepID=A0A5B7HG05_PORTR|nr:hypothetical protein [Portunus trituberculatus]
MTGELRGEKRRKEETKRDGGGGMFSLLCALDPHILDMQLIFPSCQLCVPGSQTRPPGASRHELQRPPISESGYHFTLT